MAEKEILLLLRKAVELSGDGGQQPFTEDEYDEMYNFLTTLEILFT